MENSLIGDIEVRAFDAYGTLFDVDSARNRRAVATGYEATATSLE